MQVAAVAVLCVQPEPSYRPLITDVLHSLIPLVPVELGGTLRVAPSGSPADSAISSGHWYAWTHEQFFWASNFLALPTRICFMVLEYNLNPFDIKWRMIGLVGNVKSVWILYPTCKWWWHWHSENHLSIPDSFRHTLKH